MVNWFSLIKCSTNMYDSNTFRGKFLDALADSRPSNILNQMILSMLTVVYQSMPLIFSIHICEYNVWCSLWKICITTTSTHRAGIFYVPQCYGYMFIESKDWYTNNRFVHLAKSGPPCQVIMQGNIILPFSPQTDFHLLLDVLQRKVKENRKKPNFPAITVFLGHFLRMWHQVSYRMKSMQSVIGRIWLKNVLDVIMGTTTFWYRKMQRLKRHLYDALIEDERFPPLTSLKRWG